MTQASSKAGSFAPKRYRLVTIDTQKIIEFQYHFMVYTTKVPSDGNTAFFGVLADVGNCAELARYRPVPANFDVNGHLVVAK